MPEHTVTRAGGRITIHEGEAGSPAIATFDGHEGEELFDLMVMALTQAGAATFWDANRAEYLG